LITTGNLFFGFFSIVKSLQGDFAWASVAILLAAIFDVLDGRVARMTKSTSEFGVQYDSLCDLMSFGLAPALLMYQAGLQHAGRLGWIICFMFLAAGALRLARFNVQSSIGKASGDFTGLPIPMAAAVVACFFGWTSKSRRMNSKSSSGSRHFSKILNSDFGFLA
jgi:CDP-diacylglycerol--serine O-phosphatidyltransferase